MSEEKYENLIYEASQLPFSQTKVALLEEAVRIADSLNSLQMGFEARMDLTEACVFNGQTHKGIVTLSWLLAKFDESPERYSDSTLLWKYKWIYGNIAQYPSVSIEQINEMDQDIKKRFRSAGASLRVIHGITAANAFHLGDVKTVEVELEKFKTGSRDWLSDCYACELNRHGSILFRLGKIEEAMGLVSPILNGSESCAVIPHATYANCLIPMICTGNLDDAKEYHRKGYRLVNGDRGFVREIGYHLMYLVYVDDLDKAAGCFDKNLALGIDQIPSVDKLIFLMASTFFLERLSMTNAAGRFQFRAPTKSPIAAKDGKYSISEVHDWFAKETTRLADKFDQRNGNNYVSNQVNRLRSITVEKELS